MTMATTVVRTTATIAIGTMVVNDEDGGTFVLAVALGYSGGERCGYLFWAGAHYKWVQDQDGKERTDRCSR
jgi:hypothetical protein